MWILFMDEEPVQMLVTLITTQLLGTEGTMSVSNLAFYAQSSGSNTALVWATGQVIGMWHWLTHWAEEGIVTWRWLTLTFCRFMQRSGCHLELQSPGWLTVTPFTWSYSYQAVTPFTWSYSHQAVIPFTWSYSHWVSRLLQLSLRATITELTDCYNIITALKW